MAEINKMMEEHKEQPTFDNLNRYAKKGDKTYDKIVGYLNTQNENKLELKELYGKNVVMAVGLTGVGKSTIMNAII